MPRAGFKKTPEVDVELDQTDSIFLPGDIVSGNVIVNAANSLQGKYNYISVKVFGRAKVLIIRNTNEGKDYYRGRALLFEKTVFLEGPHVPMGDKESWRFSVQIPTHTIPNTNYDRKTNNAWKVKDKFLDNQ